MHGVDRPTTETHVVPAETWACRRFEWAKFETKTRHIRCRRGLTMTATRFEQFAPKFPR
jgi:hypothetical protein